MYGQINDTPGGMIRAACLILVLLFTGLAGLGCGEKEKSQEELVIGNWTQMRNRAYILLITHPKGTWDSSVRIADATSKIVRSKGKAKGSWHIEEGQLIFTVVESDIEEIWEKNDTRFFEIAELGEDLMMLKEESGRISEWKKTGRGKGKAGEAQGATIILMSPIAVNLNKISSNAKDRYLCLSMELVLQELMPDQEIPKLHPRARDAAILFLSSLVYGDVEDFDKIKVQKKKLKDLLNPYMEGFIKDIEIKQVIIASSPSKVEEFIIEHTLTGPAKEGEGEEGEEKQDGA